MPTPSFNALCPYCQEDEPHDHDRDVVEATMPTHTPVAEERIRQAADVLGDSQTEADGWRRLIAAAPEMVDWMRGFVEGIEDIDHLSDADLRHNLVAIARQVSTILDRIEG